MHRVRPEPRTPCFESKTVLCPLSQKDLKLDPGRRQFYPGIVGASSQNSSRFRVGTLPQANSDVDVFTDRGIAVYTNLKSINFILVQSGNSVSITACPLTSS